METLHEEIICKLAYFDIFSYPLTRQELLDFTRTPVSDLKKDAAIRELVETKTIFRIDNFYALRPDANLATRRVVGNALAIKQLKTARKAATLLSFFPFVRGIAVSGSLSKNYADPKSDIDFFIITARNRLWIARTLMHFFKKITFLPGLQHWFCMNYYIDEDALEIREKNIFTAIEIITVKPMRGAAIFTDFLCANQWVARYVPPSIRLEGVKAVPAPLLKRVIEKCFNNRFGERLECYLMNVTQRRWNRKTAQKRLTMRGILMGMDAGRHYAKPQPHHFQDKIIEQYAAKTADLLRTLKAVAV